jgi:transcriptional regulator with XRE-family HTH domain
MARPHSKRKEPIGEVLRSKRVGDLGLGLREMARRLEIAPAHLTDIEKGRRAPSEELLLRIAEAYDLPLPSLRSGWQKPDAVIAEVANQDEIAAEKVPQLLRAVREFSPEQWETLIAEAKRLSRANR